MKPHESEMSTLWKSFWDKYRYDGVVSDETLFEQVGRTVNGRPVDALDFGRSIEFVVQTLRLQPDDVVVEYCCGNGLVTYEIGRLVREVFAFDFSEHLVDAARRFRQRENIQYWIADAFEPLPAEIRNRSPKKCLMSFALGHFDAEGLDRILANLYPAPGPQLFLFTGIPDMDKQASFYNTPERQARFRELSARGDVINDGIGKWWDRSEITAVAARHGLQARYFDEPGPSNQFRMAVLLTAGSAAVDGRHPRQ